VTDTLTPVMKSKTTAEWVEALEALKIACGPINTLKDVFADPHVVARGMRHRDGACLGRDGEGHGQPGPPFRDAADLPQRAAHAGPAQ
jgi:crotonobetainyl-CoA:carnitine CoA-transferase CaiB-like acyl-CoA transferase